MLNKRLFKSTMMLHEDTNISVSRIIGISPQRVSAKINALRGAEFTQSEIEKLKIKWSLTPDEVDAIFFAV